MDVPARFHQASSLSDSWTSRTLFGVLKYGKMLRSSSEIDWMFGILMAVFLSAFFANMSILFQLVTCHRRLAIKKSTFDVLFLSLTIANLLSLFPLVFSYNFVEMDLTEVNNGNCLVMCCVDYFLQVVIVSHLAVITFDRYKSRNASYREDPKVRHYTFIALAICWVLGFSLTVLHNFTFQSAEYSYPEATCVVSKFRVNPPFNVIIHILVVGACVVATLVNTVRFFLEVDNFDDLLHIFTVMIPKTRLVSIPPPDQGTELRTFNSHPSNSNTDSTSLSEIRPRSRSFVKSGNDASEDSSLITENRPRPRTRTRSGNETSEDSSLISPGMSDSGTPSEANGSSSAERNGDSRSHSVPISDDTDQLEERDLPPLLPPAYRHRHSSNGQASGRTHLQVVHESHVVSRIVLGAVLTFTIACFVLQIWFNLRYLVGDIYFSAQHAFACRVLFYCVALANPIHYGVYRKSLLLAQSRCMCCWCSRLKNGSWLCEAFCRLLGTRQ